MKSLPAKGLSEDEVMSSINDYLKLSEVDFEKGALSGCVYGGDKNITDLTTKVYSKFLWSNPMHADVFPEVRKMEAEVVRMTCNLFHGDENTCGTV